MTDTSPPQHGSKRQRFARPRTRWSRLWLERLERRDTPSTVITAFAPRYTRNDTGDIAIIGNTLLTAPAGAAGDNARNGIGAALNNNNFNMVNVDVDSDTSTFNSSRATLAMPSGATVLWAGLYWGADSSNAARNQVKFQTPATGAYVNLTGIIVGATGGDYHAFSDVTSLVQLSGNGVYTAANVQATINQTDKHAGWGLVVVYRDPTAAPKNLTVFDGFVLVNTAAPSTISTTISGFVTPVTGAVNAKVGFITYEGDLGFNGDFCRLNGTTLTDALNPADNFFNSTFSNLGVPATGRTPNYVNQLGFDADIVSAPGAVPNNASSATVTVGTTNETYYPSVITTAIDIYAPVFVSPKTMVDVNGGDINPGDILEYTVNVQNTGGDNANLSVLTDPIPTYTSYVPGSLQILTGANVGAKSDAAGDDQAEFDSLNNRVVFRLGIGANSTTGGAMIVGASSQVRFRVQVAANIPNNTAIINQATATGQGATAGLVVSAASSAAAAVVSAPAAGLHLEKAVNNAQPNVGDTITFTLTLTNNGPSTANGVVVRDQLPAGLTLLSATGTGSYNSGTGDWTVGTLINGAVATLTVTAVVASPNASTNTATITATSTYDPDPSDNTASTPVTPRRADLGIFKSIDVATPNVGQVITYTLAVTNFGPDAASGVVVTDSLPAGVTFVSATTLFGTYNSGTGIWAVGNLANAQTAYLTIRGQVTSASPGVNTATITGAAQYDPNPSNNTSSASLTPQLVDLSIIKTVDDATPISNQIITFTISITNAGPSSATNVRVSDLLPPGLVYVSSTPSQGTYDSTTNIWTVGTVNNGVSRTLTLQTRVVDPAPSINRAVISSDQYDPDPADNMAVANVVPETADIDLDKLVSSSGPNVGDTIAYSVRVRNRGPNDATNVLVNDLLPAGVTFASAIASQGTYTSGTGIWTVGSLAVGAEASLTILVTVVTPSAIINTASGTSDQFDPVPNNNIAQSSITPRQADLKVVKSVNISAPNLDGTVTYSVTVTNDGPDAATAPTVYDPLPGGLELVSASATSGMYDQDNGRWSLPNLASGASATLTLVARVLGPGAPLNVVRVSAAEFDPDSTNNQATVPLTPNAHFSGSVFEDLNDDGLRGVNEPGISGVTVQLRDSLNNIVATTTTDVDGVYTFPSVAPGLYSIVELQPSGYSDGKDAAGTTGGTVGNDTISLIPVTAGARLTGYSFGEHTIPPTVTISNGSATEGSPVVFTVSLSNPSGIPIVLDMTASGGTATSGVDYSPINVEYSTDGGLSWLPGGGVNGTHVTVPTGSAGIQVRVASTPDSIDEPNETFTLSGAAVSGSVAAITSGTGTVIDDDLAPTITIGNGSATEGSNVVFGVNLSNASSAAIVLNLTATDVTAIAGTDYSANNFEFSINGGGTWLPGTGPGSTQVTIPANSTGILVRVASTADTIDEPNETFTLAGAAVSGTVTAINSGTGTIIDDDPAPTINIGNGSATEGNNVVLGLSLSNASSTAVVLNLTASNITATAGADFTASNFEFSTNGGGTWQPGTGPGGTQVTIPANMTSIQVRIASISDTIDEANETFLLFGTPISGSVSVITSGTGTIIDDDPAPTITIGNGSATEGSNVVFGVNLSNASSTAIVLNLTTTDVTAIAGTDYTASNFEYSINGGGTWLPGTGPGNTQVTIPANSTGILVRVASTADTIDEPNETFALAGTAVSGTVTAINSGTGTIIDDDPAPTITIGNGSATEGSNVVFGVTLSNASSTAIVLNLTASNVTATAGTDYTANNFEFSTNGGGTWLPGTGPGNTQVTIPANSTGILVRVASTADTIDEPNETFALAGTAVSGTVTAINSGTGTIIDDDPAPTITIGNGSATEGSNVVFGVNLSNASSTAIVVNLTATDITAIAGTDYTANNFEFSTNGGGTWLPGTGPGNTQVTIPANSTGILVRVASTADTIDEPNETFTLAGAVVSGAVTAINAGTGTIVDDDSAPTINIGNGSATEGNNVVLGVNLSNASSAAIVLNLTATDVTAIAGTDYTANNFEFSINGGGTWLPGTGPGNTQVTIPANSTGILVRVASTADTIDEPIETFTLAGTAVSGPVAAINSGTGTIIDDDSAPTITIGNGSATEGSNVVFGVSLSNASSTDIVISLMASTGSALAGTDFVTTNFEYSIDGGLNWLLGTGPTGTRVTIPAGSLSILARVASVQDSFVESDETFTLSGTAFSGAVTAVNSGIGTIVNDDSPPIVTISSGSAQEGQPVVFDVTLSNPSLAPIVLDMTAASGSAIAGTDFSATLFEYSIDGGVNWIPGGGPNGTELTVPAGSTSIQVRVASIQDTIDEPNEGFTLTGTPVSETITSINTATGTIIDDDPAPTITIGNTSANEGQLAIFALSLTNPSSTAIVLDLTATSGTATAATDFATTNFEYSVDGGLNWIAGAGPNGTQVTIPANGTAIQVRVATTSDNIDETNETFTLAGVAVSGSVTAINSGTGTILDDDPAPTITIGNASTIEGQRAVFALSLSNPSVTPIILDLTASNGTANSGSDFATTNFEYSTDGGLTWLPGSGVNGTQVTIPAGNLAIGVRIATTQDTLAEPTEAFSLSGIVTSGAASIANVATATILDNDLAPSSVAGEVFHDTNGNGRRDAGESGIAGVTITLTGTNNLGQPINRVFITGPSGTFIFTGLLAGNYTLTQSQPINFANGTVTPGSQGGVAGVNRIDFVLQGGVAGVGNAFAQTLAANRLGNKEQLLASTPRYGAVLSGFNLNSLSQSPSFANAVATTQLGPINPARLVATGAGAGGTPHVRVFDYSIGAERFNFFAYDSSFRGGVRVAVGDVNGDGTDDIITGPGAGGGPHVRVFSGVNGQVISDFMAFAPTFSGGIYVAAGDIDGNGTAEIIVGAGEGGGPHVRVFNAAGGVVSERFVFTPGFSGGVRVAAGDVNNDGFDDVVVAAGPGGGPHVRAFSAGLSTVLHDFFAYDASFRGGVSVAVGDVNGDGAADIITGPASNGGPHVKAFSGLNLSLLANLFAFSPAFAGGVNVGARDTNGDGRADIIVAPASDLPSYIRIIDVASGNDLDAFLGYGPGFRGGVFVG